MALRLNARASVSPALAETGIEVMATGKTAPANGVIRHQSGSARRVRKGALIPAGWTFDDGSQAAEAPSKKGGKKATEDTKAEGPSETA
jgi:hypothetical protein